jgi:hypothetical protein
MADDYAFVAEVDGQEPTAQPTLQSAMDWVEHIANPSGAIFYTLYGAHTPIVTYRDGEIDIA